MQTTYTYEPFGTASVTGQANTNPYQYTARENDGTGLDYYRARYYSPSRQRFISEDPISFGGGDPNLYAYVFNSSPNDTDPSGEIAPLVASGVACGAGALGGVAVTFSGRKPPSWWQIAAGAGIGCGSGLVVLGGWAIGAVLVSGTAVSEAAITVGALGAPLINAAQAIAGKIGGYTRHGLNQAIGRDGNLGVSPQAILDAVRNPNQVIQQADGTVMYVGQNAKVVLNQFGQVVTTWATHSAGWRGGGGLP